MPQSESILNWFERMQREGAGFEVEPQDQVMPSERELKEGAHWLVRQGDLVFLEGIGIGALAKKILAYRPDRKFFQLVYARVLGARREIDRWHQIFMEEQDAKVYRGRMVSGLILLVRREIEGRIEFLVRALAQPGNTDVPANVLLAPTIQASFSNIYKNGDRIPLWNQLGINLEALENDVGQNTGFIASIQPKDGGRFLDSNNLMIARNLSPQEAYTLNLGGSESHRWSTGQEIRLLQQRGLVNPHLNEILGMSRFDE